MMHNVSPTTVFMTWQPRLLSAWITLVALLLSTLLPSVRFSPTMPPALQGQNFAQLPLAFAPNLGQSDPSVQMQTNGLAGTITFAATSVALTLPARQAETPVTLRLTWEGANPQATITGADRLPGLYHTYVGKPAQWRSNLPTYAAALYQDLYPGIDLRYDGKDGLLKSTYYVARDADPAQIRWHYQEAQAVTLDSATGNLVIHLADGSRFVEDAPIAWQETGDGRVPVTAQFVIENGRIHFALGAYNRRLPLIIDPSLHYSTFLGGNSSDYGTAIALAPNGDVIVSGQTYSSDFLGAGGTRKGTTDLFVSRLNAQGTALLYTTLIGGSDDEETYGLALDHLGNAWLTGATRSEDFPANALWHTYDDNGDTFVTKLDSSGALLRSGYLGLSVHDMGYAIAVDTQGDAYVAGEVAGTYGPESFVKKIKADMSEILYAAYFGGADRGFNKGTSVRAIAVDPQGNAYVTGRTNAILSETDDGGFQPFCTESDGLDCTFDDALVLKLNPAGNAALFFTYLGGHGNDIGTDIALDPQGNILVTGYTFAADFPTQNALQPTKRGLDNFTDAFVTKLTPQGDALLYSTYLGGDAWEEGHSLAVDHEGNAYVVGMTNSPNNFPISTDAPQPTLSGICSGGGSGTCHCYDGFATKLTATGALVWSTFVGGADDDQANGIAIDGNGNAYIVGSTESNGFPTTTGVVQGSKAASDDAFVVKIGVSSNPPPTPPPPTPNPTIEQSARLYLPLAQR